MNKLIKAFNEAVNNNEIIDSSMAGLSDDGEVVTYSVSKFYDLAQSHSFNLVAFMGEFKKKYSSYQMESTDDGFSMTKVVSGIDLSFEVDLYDESLKLEIFTTESSDNTESSVKELANVMLKEFESFNSMLFKNNH